MNDNNKQFVDNFNKLMLLASTPIDILEKSASVNDHDAETVTRFVLSTFGDLLAGSKAGVHLKKASELPMSQHQSDLMQIILDRYIASGIDKKASFNSFIEGVGQIFSSAGSLAVGVGALGGAGTWLLTRDANENDKDTAKLRNKVIMYNVLATDIKRRLDNKYNYTHV